jgi:glycerol kinase
MSAWSRLRAQSRSPVQPCNGCVISSASSPAPLRSSRSRGRPTTTAACISCQFSGLYAPHWRSDARGAIVGLSCYNTNAHLARATLEAICYQSKDVVDAMTADSGVQLRTLKVDGGVTANELCMQLQADILGVTVSRPVVAETTALGAAYAAGLAVGFWSDTEELKANWNESKRWQPQWSDEQRATGYAGWRKAVDRSLGWVDVE